MKYFMVTLRTIIAFIFTGLNFGVNAMVCSYIKPRLGMYISVEWLAVLAAVGVFIYIIAQIGLWMYLMARSMIASCKKYGIKYR